MYFFNAIICFQNFVFEQRLILFLNNMEDCNNVYYYTTIINYGAGYMLLIVEQSV